jgi:hypothetical protein
MRFLDAEQRWGGATHILAVVEGGAGGSVTRTFGTTVRTDDVVGVTAVATSNSERRWGGASWRE